MPLKPRETAGAVQEIVRLRRLERQADPALRAELRSVRAYLETVAGPTVSRAQAARLLGLSQTALERWIARGEIASVLTPEGRREVPLTELTPLLEDVQDVRGRGADRAVGRVIRERRRKSAEAIDIDRLLPPRRPRSHRIAELQSLAYHRVVAQRLSDEIVQEARHRLDRWRGEGRIDERWAQQWERVLEQPLGKLADAISADTPRARDLRQTSPFLGVLNEQERRELLRAVEARA